jgi:hypothetical protein
MVKKVNGAVDMTAWSREDCRGDWIERAVSPKWRNESTISPLNEGKLVELSIATGVLLLHFI